MNNQEFKDGRKKKPFCEHGDRGYRPIKEFPGYEECLYCGAIREAR